MHRKLPLVSIAFCASLLTACGGGGDGGTSAAAPKAEGAWAGTLTGSTSSAFQLLVLENDEYWALYGTNSGNVFYVAGFVQGSGSSSSGSFTSSNAKDFGFTTPMSGSVTASYVAGTSIQGTIAEGGGSVGFNGAPIAASSYNYATTPNLADVQGAWNLTALGGAAATLNVAANGSFSGSSQGCAYTGQLTPRPSGKNVFNFTVTFGASPCLLPGQSATGVAISNVVPGTPTRQLIAAGVNGARTAGTALFGTR